MNSVAITDREKAAKLVAQWCDGEITNWDLDDAWPYESQDRAVVDIGRELWCHYSDYPKARLKLSALSAAETQLLKRCLEFLKSTEEYEPVPYEEVVPWKPSVLTRLFGVKERPWETMRLKVNTERQQWWPFADEAQWQKTMTSH